MEKLVLEKIDKKDFEYFYEIMEEAFPEDEHRNKDEQRKLFKEELYNVSGYKKNNEVIGFIAYWDFDGFDYIEHFAVKRSYRNKSIGSTLLKKFLDRRKKKVILEVEYPEDKITVSRINFYKRIGFYLNDYEYIQPSYEIGRNEIPLKIMSYKNLIGEDEYNEFKNSVYANVYKCI